MSLKKLLMGHAFPFDVSLVVVNWNTCCELEVCLRSFSETSGSLRLETIVVDNASADDSAAMVRSKFPSIRLFVNDVNLGFGAAVNQGIKAAQGKYILVLNPDIVAVEGSLLALKEALDSFPDVGAVAPRLVNPDGSVQKGYFRKFPSLLQVLLFYTSLSPYAYSSRWLVSRFFENALEEDHAAYDVQQIPGGCIMVRREVIDTVGLMEERFFLFFEDVDWCYRMRQHGWRLQVINGVSMVHLGGRSFATIENYWMFGRLILSLNQFVDKHGSLWLKGGTKVITFSNSLSIILVRSVQRFFNLYGKNRRNFEHSHRIHSYLLKLLFEYYFGIHFSSRWQGDIVP